MLINITDKCSMGCSHCSENCTINGEHMTMETFKETLKFVCRLNPTVIVITGGEPTDHPEFISMMNLLKKRVAKERICITSNGLFLENPQYTKDILDLGITIQITNDRRYYPKRVPIINNPLLVYEDHIRSIYPLGRAVTNGIEKYGTQAPKCFNCRSISKSTNNLIEAIRILEANGKLCTPSIDIKGNIKAGEFNACNPVGNINDSQATIFNNIRNLKCNNCGMEDVLSPFHLAILKQ